MCRELILNSLVMQSALYNLPDEKERLKSNQELANLFANIAVDISLQMFYAGFSTKANNYVQKI